MGPTWTAIDPPPVEPGDYAEDEPEEKPEEVEWTPLPDAATEEDLAFAALTGWTHYYSVY